MGVRLSTEAFMSNSARERVQKFGLAAATVAAFLLCAGATRAQNAGYLHVVTPQGAIDGASKDPAHMNWISISSVVAGDLNGDAMADREASAPSVSEIQSPRDLATGQASGRKSGSIIVRDSSSSAVRESPTKASTGKTMVRESPTLTSGMATGKRMHKPLTITKELDKASPLLAQACASGQHLKEVDVALASKPGGFYKLTDVLISSDQKSASSGGDRPMETISFTYQKIEWTR
jgi:type VI protein secretion system component Hcp